MEFNMEAVLKKLKSASEIEQVLKKTYIGMKYPVLERKSFSSIMPLLNAHLYKLIISLHRLPSDVEFVESYMNTNHSKAIGKRSELTIKSVTHIAYLSLVRDLHFYFVLKESGLFDDVRIEYLYDLYAKNDILLTKNGRKLGLQLYSGGEKATERKLIEHRRRKLILRYDEILFSLENDQSKRLVIRTYSNQELKLYSDEDAFSIADFFTEKEGETLGTHLLSAPAWDEDSFLLPKKPTITGVVKKYSMKKAKHSILYVVDKSNVPNADERSENRENGITTYVIEVTKKDFDKLGIEPMQIVDGYFITEDLKEKIKQLASSCNFNIDQYLIEHDYSNNHILVTAGAGCGKTFTMVSRIMFLLHMGKVNDIAQIAMITFTNEAADQMRLKLEERLLGFFKDTGKEKYLLYLEQLTSMKIMTIPSFAKTVISEFGHYLGLGQELKVTNLSMEKRRIIRKNMDELVRKNNVNINEFNLFRDYQLLGFLEEVWDAVEQKGLIVPEIQDMISGFSDGFDKFVGEVILNSEYNFNIYKKDNNNLTVNDLTRNLKHLNKDDVPLGNLKSKIRYLFIDEFQDTDNSQIAFISQMAIKAGIELFVVGDVKQSIYRFRGANSTAFDSLVSHFKGSEGRIKKYSLKMNYRTSSVLLDKMENIFDYWKHIGYLPSNEDRMISHQVNSADVINEPQYIEEKINGRSILNNFSEMVSGSDANAPILALLVRTNKQAVVIREMLDKCKGMYGSDMPVYEVILEGTLFVSDAARDLLLLVESWLSPSDNYSLFGLSQTPFVVMDKEIVIETQSNSINGKDEYIELKIPLEWERALEDLKLDSAIRVLRRFLSSVNLEESLRNEKSDLQQKKYRKNLFKIIDLAANRLHGKEHDILAIKEWLKLQIATNTHDDEAELDANDFNGAHIKVLTVHKAKGLEYDTVIVPFNKTPFNTDNIINEDILVLSNEEGKFECGWKIVRDGNEQYTENYSDLKSADREENNREETRILYVAMTRAERRLIFYDMKGKLSGRNRNWFDLIKGK